MSRLILQGIALITGLVLTAGCATPTVITEQPERQPAPPVVRQEARLHLPAEPTTLDSAKAADPVAFDLLGNLMEGLVRLGEGGAVEPGVAERWETTDGRHFTFFLRKDARWSDGRQVTADDFVYAWKRALDPEQGSDYAFLLYDIAGAEAWNSLDPQDPQYSKRTGELMRQVQVTASDSTTLQVTLRVANPYWINYITHPIFYPQRASVIAREGKRYGTAGGELVGNGPFTLAEWTTGEQIILRKNLAYWDTQAVQLDRAHFRIEQDGQAALRLYELGELDQVVLPGELAAKERAAQHMVQPSTLGMVFNLARKGPANLNLRRAIHLAVDRARLVEAVAPLNAIPSEGLVPPALANGWQPEASVRIPPTGELSQARELWAQARKELQIESMTMGLLHTPETEHIAQAVKTQVEEHLNGLTVQLESVSFEQRLERTRTGQFDMVVQGWAADHNDPLTLLELFVADGPGNDARWISQEYDQRILAARLGEADRKPTLVAGERLLLEQLPALPLYHPIRYTMTKDRLKGVRTSPLGARLDLKSAFIEG